MEKSDNIFYKKYLKYKQKYLNMIKGGNDEVRLHISDPWFTLIKNGKKIAEGRPDKGLFKSFKKGQIITIFNNQRKEDYQVKITDKKHYKTFAEMLEKEGLGNVLPNLKGYPEINTIEDGVNVYRQWYSEEVEKEFGVVAIHMHVIKSKDLDGKNNKEEKEENEQLMNNIKTYHFSFFDPEGCPLTKYILDGTKTVEGRKYSPKYAKIKKGDQIIFHIKNGEVDKILCEVTYVHKYKTVEEYLEKEGLEKALPCPNVKTIEDGIEIYNKFSLEADREQLREKFGYGFLGIGIKVSK